MDRRRLLHAGLLAGAGALAACSPIRTEPTMPSRPTTSSPTPSGPGGTAAAGRVLLAYFSRPGENYYYGDRINLTTGNTQVVAELIAGMITADVYRIEAAEPYPDDYEQTRERNVREEQQNARPALAGEPPDASGYETILLGCPVWNVQTPMILRTFVEGVDLAGKTLHPFVTYAVSGMGRVRTDYTELLPDTTITEGLAVRGEEAQRAGPEVEAWLRRVGLLPE